MTASKVRLAALLAAGGLALATAGTAQPPAAAPALTFTREERTAIAALQTAAAGTDRAAQDAAVQTARGVARSANARYAVANLHFQIARQRGDAQAMAAAADEMIASGVPQGAELSALLANQASRAFSANDLRRLDRILERMVEAQPNHPAVLADAGQMKARLGDRPAAVALLQRALAAHRASGRPAPESWHQRALGLAVEGRLVPQSISLGRELVAAYPSPANWRDVLLTYRQAVAGDPALELDIRRLARAGQGLAGERDYLDHAQAFARAHPGEAKAALDEGVSRGMLNASEAAVRQAIATANPAAARERTGLAAARTRALAAADGASALAAGDAHFGHGQYAQAAELYRAALQKGGQDPNLVNTRLGAALALAGQRTEAEAAFRLVTGPRAELAGYWLAWLAGRPSA
ncbi:MAG: hypothetical protein ACT4N8_10370 [Sphingosinicella sp.]|uniref:hypothetical protein n=1 Tax=Sphingosinicella sp. TaxID=1917971 RepID=UPI0040378DD8